MNFMTIAVVFLLLFVFINDVPLVISHFDGPRRYSVGKFNDYHDYRWRPKPHKDNVGRDSQDRTIKRLTCHGSETIKGLNGNWDFHCSHNPKCTEIWDLKPRRIVNPNPSTGEINYICRGYISGIRYSRGDNDPFDGLYSISCCQDNQSESHEDCYWSGWQNCFGSSFKFWVPDGYYMAGIRSEYNSSVKNGYSRIWDFYVCK